MLRQEHTRHADGERQLCSACVDSWSLDNGAAGKQGTYTEVGFKEFSLKLQCFAKPGDIEDTELLSSAMGKRCAPSKTASWDLRNRPQEQWSWSSVFLQELGPVRYV